MKRLKVCFTCLNILCFLSICTFIWSGTRAKAFDDPDDSASSPAATEAPADAPAAADTAAAAPSAPTLPDYITASNAANKWPDPAGSNAGYWTTPSAPPGDGDPAQQTPASLYDRIAHNLFSINMVWTLVTAFLVMFMQAGFALVEGGLCRAKNSAHTMAMNFMIYPLGCLGFWAYGFALGWGNWYNGPVAPGWYASLGPGLSVLNQGIGIGGAPNVPDYGLMGTKGWSPILACLRQPAAAPNPIGIQAIRQRHPQTIEAKTLPRPALGHRARGDGGWYP